MIKTACAYVRVSTDKQEELSPDSQIREIKEYAARNNMLISKIYVEEHGISGKNASKRPAFQKMIAACKEKSHPYDVVLVWKFSRFARNIDESTYYKSILRKKCNVDVQSVSEPIIEGMYGRLIEMVIEWSDEFYLYNLSGEVHRGMTENALRGGYNSNAPLGYIKKKGCIPEIDPPKADIVKHIYDMYTKDDMTMADIAAKLNTLDFRSNRGSKFEIRTIQYILDNPFYIGKIRWNYYDRNNHQRKNKDEVIIVDGKHEPIITDEQWSLVQSKRCKAKKHGGSGRKRTSVTAGHWLSGMIACSECGSNLGYHRDVHFFNCWKHAKGVCHSTSSITESKAIQEVLSALQSLAASDFYYIYSEQAGAETDDLEVKRMQSELDSLSVKLKRVKEAYRNGVDTLDEYRENKQLIMARQNELEAKLATLETPIAPKQNRKKVDFGEIIRLIQDESVTTEQKATAIRKIFDHFEWNREKQQFTAFLSDDIMSTQCSS